MEHLNPVIIIALIIQALISRASHLAGSIAGYLITTGILIWGLGLYSDGDAIAIFGIVLSKPAFIISCLIWYGFDTYELSKGRPVEVEELDEETQEYETSQES